MSIAIDGIEMETVHVDGQKMERVFVNGVLVYEATIYVAKPSVAGSLTYNGSAQKPTITGYDSAAMTVSGTQSATLSGTYTIKFTLNKGYAWKDGTTDNLTFTWTIAKKSVTKPTLSGTYTYNRSAQSVTIKNYDSAAMTLTGTKSATEAGTYHVYFVPNTNYQWTDGTTTKLDLTWTIGKRSIPIPSLATTIVTWVEGNTHTITVNNLDTNYVTQSGTISATDSAKNLNAYTAVTWTLKNTNSTQWTDGTTANKKQDWRSKWVDGTSHWAKDWYNRGWCGVELGSVYASFDKGSASKPYITLTGTSSGKIDVLYVNELQSSVIGLGMEVKAASADSGWTRLCCVSSSKSNFYAYTPKDEAQTWSLDSELWTRLEGTESSVSGKHYPGIAFSGDTVHYIERIWHD